MMIFPACRNLSSGAWRVLLAVLLGMASTACDDAVEAPNAPAEVRAVGNIDQPIDGCAAAELKQADASFTDLGLLVDANTLDGGIAPDAQVIADTGDADADSRDADSWDADSWDADSWDADSWDADSRDADSRDADSRDADSGGPITDAGKTDADVSSPDADTGANQSDAGDGDTGSNPAPPTGTRLSRAGNRVVIPYLLYDREGDDQDIKVEICHWDGQTAVDCGVARQADGGDGTTAVPTTPAGSCRAHDFYWDTGCGRFTPDPNGDSPRRVSIESPDQQLVARVSVIGSDDDPTTSEPFTLADLGFQSVPECQ